MLAAHELFDFYNIRDENILWMQRFSDTGTWLVFFLKSAPDELWQFSKEAISRQTMSKRLR